MDPVVMALALLAVGGVLLYFGAEWSVGGASSLALSLRVPKLLVGLTVVAYGTSAPELVVGIQASLEGSPGVALGNVLGSNIANAGLILGISALLRPAIVDGALRRRELPVLVLSTLAIPVVLWDGAFSRVEAGVLVLFALVYSVVMVLAARRPSTLERGAVDAAVVADVADAAGAPGNPLQSTVRAAAITVVGLAVLLLGGSLFVDGATGLAKALGMSDRLIGLTVVAIGTSLPELISSVVAARRGFSDLAVGNIIGSNIFNALLCLGSAGLVAPMQVPLVEIRTELIALLVVSGLAVLFFRTARTVTRLEGAVALASYVAFMVVTIVGVG